jgi:hypothetical protein
VRADQKDGKALAAGSGLVSSRSIDEVAANGGPRLPQHGAVPDRILVVRDFWFHPVCAPVLPVLW